MNIDLTGLHDIITPTALEFKRSSIVFGEQYANVMVIMDYPISIGTGWLSKVTKLPGILCSIHLKPKATYTLLEYLHKTADALTTRMVRTRNPLFKQRAQVQIEQAQQLLKKIDQDNQQVFGTTVLLRVIAKNEEQLQQRTRHIESRLAAQGLRGRVLVYRQEDALKGVAPWALLPKSIEENYSFNMPSETVAASFPFTFSGINDGSGMILGRDSDGGVVLVNMWNQVQNRVNSNWLVLGKSGVGKSTAVKKILVNNFAQGCKVIVIDPEREYKELCKKLAGNWINICRGSGAHINPLQVKEVPSRENSDASSGFVANHFHTLRTFFKVYLRDLNDIKYALLEQTIEELYQNHNITYETNPNTLSAEDWPIMEDLYRLLIQKSNKQPEYQELATLTRRAAIGSDAGLYNGHTSLDTDNDFIVIDTFGLQESSIENRRALLFNTLTWVWNEVIKDSSQRIVIAIDEAYLLVDKDTPQAMQFLKNTSKRIRKYNGSLITISQNTNDFLDPDIAKYGQALVDNPTYKLIMGQGENDLSSLTSLMDLTEAEVDILAQGIRGEALLFIGPKRIHAKIELSDLEVELFRGGTVSDS